MKRFSQDPGVGSSAAGPSGSQPSAFSPAAILRRIGRIGLGNRHAHSIRELSAAQLRDIGMNPMEAWLPRSCLPSSRQARIDPVQPRD